MPISKNLILIRHTKSSWKDFSLSDFDRPIKKDRMNDATEVFNQLNDLKIRPDVLITSPAKRTVQTTKILCKAIGYSFEAVVKDMRLYETGYEEYLSVIREIDQRNNTVVIIGHNPSLTTLCNYFHNVTIEHIPTTGVVWLSIESEDWQLLSNNHTSIKLFLHPTRKQ